MSQKRKFVSDYVFDHDAAEYSELLRVFRQELRAHYELPKYLPHQILTLMTALIVEKPRTPSRSSLRG